MTWIRERRWFRRKTLGILMAKLILGCASDLAAQTHAWENFTPSVVPRVQAVVQAPSPK